MRMPPVFGKADSVCPYHRQRHYSGQRDPRNGECADSVFGGPSGAR
jgi:hypothetical protein